MNKARKILLEKNKKIKQNLGINRPKYSLEIATDGAECTALQGTFYGWLNYDTIYADGNSLQECLSTAEVSLMDQHGGNPIFIIADEDWMQDLIVAEFNKKYGGK